MKKKLLLLLLYIAPFCLLAQKSETEAMAAYLLSEESYATGDYSAAIKFLEKAEEKLGGTNSKLLFLKIQIETELYKKDKSYYDRIMRTISDFQTAPDIRNFNKDKVLEIVKMKMAMESQREEQMRVTKKLREEREKNEANFKNFSFEGWHLNVDLEDLKISNMDSTLFKRKLIERNAFKVMLKDIPSNWKCFFNHGTTGTKHNNRVNGIFIDNNTVKGYIKYFKSKDPKNEIDYLTKYFSFTPKIIKEPAESGLLGWPARTMWVWKFENKVVKILVFDGSPYDYFLLNYNL